MTAIKDKLRALCKDETGATVTEYVILLLLIACFVIAIVRMFAEPNSPKVENGAQQSEKNVDL